MDDAAMRSLLLWVQSFDDTVAADGHTVETLADLSDGVFLSHLMHRIHPEYMNLKLVHHKTARNWALKASNLQILLRAIELFYDGELDQSCEAQELIDATLIAKHEDPKEISRLVELLLGCAVQCQRKSKFIHPIMQMDASHQASMMHTIESVLHPIQLASPHHEGHDGHGSHSDQPQNSMDHLHDCLSQALKKASQMESMVLDMEREKRELTGLLKNALAEKLTLAAKHVQLEHERDTLLSERQRTRACKGEYIQQIVEQAICAMTGQLAEEQAELARVKRQASERMVTLEHEVRRQADELDISRSKISQLSKLEASVPKYKKKIQEMHALRIQVKDLQSHNAQCLEKVVDLESAAKTIPVMKMLVEKYKNQVAELESAIVEAFSRDQIKNQEITRLQDTLDSAMDDKAFLENQLKEQRSQLANVQRHREQGDDDDDGENDGDDLTGDEEHGAGARCSTAADFVPGDDSLATLRERVARLERENADLTRRGATNGAGNRGGGDAKQSNALNVPLQVKTSLQATLHQPNRQNITVFAGLEVIQLRRAEMNEAAGKAPPSSASGGPVRLGFHQAWTNVQFAILNSQFVRLHCQRMSTDVMPAALTTGAVSTPSDKSGGRGTSHVSHRNTCTASAR